ncbi:hypothetical protein M408DRAFT_184506 [Serendipita vermifera MAFF 305830]|uniref:Uncharacterized protein n=1 Tax=Serendipita vermifera MAFF 305830 TaxID=933852 RepID=A0A0C2XUU2_SERVB|nr:hypothetical protein M408DRAFT_184506 [Serendipita vermifera MAFF 305830]
MPSGTRRDIFFHTSIVFSSGETCAHCANQGRVTDTMVDAEYVILGCEVSIAGWAQKIAARVRDPDWLEDLLKKKLGTSYSAYLNLPAIQGKTGIGAPEARTISGPKQPATRTISAGLIPPAAPKRNKSNKSKVINTDTDTDEENGDQPESSEFIIRNGPAKSRTHGTDSTQKDDPDQTESSGDEEPPLHSLKTLSAPSLPILRHKQGILLRPHPVTGFACWRQRPRVLVPNSDPSQSISPATSKSQRTQSSTQPSLFKGTQCSKVVASLSSDHPEKPVIIPTPHAQIRRQSQSQRNSKAVSFKEVKQSTLGQETGTQADTSDGDYDPANHSFDEDSNDDDWSENSSDEDDLESFTYPNSQVYTLSGKRNTSILGRAENPTGGARLDDAYWGHYLSHAVHRYGKESQSQTQSQTQTEWGTQAIQTSSQTPDGRSRGGKASGSSRWSEQRHRLVSATLSFISHWLQIPLTEVRDAWKHLPEETKTFEELQKWCLERDLRSTSDSKGIFTLPSPRSKRTRRGDGDGLARKRRNLGSQTLKPRNGSNTDEESDFQPYSDGVNGSPSSQKYDAKQEDDGAKKSPPIRFRQVRILTGDAKNRFPYPTKPDQLWAKRTCRLLGAVYGISASKVHRIWEEVDGDTKQIETILKDRASTKQYAIHNFGLGDIPRPWL